MIHHTKQVNRIIKLIEIFSDEQIIDTLLCDDC